MSINLDFSNTSIAWVAGTFCVLLLVLSFVNRKKK